MYYQLCRQSICSICSACNRSVSNDCIVSNVSRCVSIVSNVSIVDNISIVRSVSSVCNSKKCQELKSYQRLILKKLVRTNNTNEKTRTVEELKGDSTYY